jgi:heptosyltransferase III
MPALVPQSILIINNRLIGDVVLTTPLIDIFAKEFPGVAIDFLVNRGTGEFLEKDPRVRQVFYSDKWKSGKESSGSYLAKLFRKYDLAISLNYSDRAGIATVIAGRKKRIGFYDSRKKISQIWRKLLFTQALPYQDGQHVIRTCQDIARVLGIEPEKLRVRIMWDSDDASVVASLFAAVHAQGDYFVIHPFARWHYKYWDIYRFAELSDTVARTYDLIPVWSSSPDKNEMELLVNSSQKCEVRPILVPGLLTLNQMACLLQSAKLYIGLDTAISHIAASTGVPTVALYGPTEMWRWHPWDNESSVNGSEAADTTRGTYRSGTIVALQAVCEHYPCIRPHCYHEGCENPCMMALSTRDVLQEICSLFSKTFTGGSYEVEGNSISVRTLAASV